MHLFAHLLDIVLPPHEDVRRARRLTQDRLSALFAPRTGAFPWITALFPYRDPDVRALIRAVKYHNETRTLRGAARMLGEHATELVSDKVLLDGWRVPLAVPIPASARRRRERGYGQAERILAAALPFMDAAVDAAPRALAREERASQVTAPRAERAANIAGAFSVPNPAAVRGRYIILIDDVTESGATLADARRALLDAGAADVIAVTLAQ